MNKITIAIDGYSSTGKSTLAKQLAKVLGYIYVDSGAMYRAVTLFALRKGLISKGAVNRATLIARLPEVMLEFKYDTQLGHAEIYLNGENVEKQIRGMEVSQHVSSIATVPEVRSHLVRIQKQLGANKEVVMDGRDIGTVVFPDAELKIFMTASAETRARRRYEELIAKGEMVSFGEVLNNVTERDRIDTHRKQSPLKQAEDAIILDNSNLTLEEQFKEAYALVRSKLDNS